MLCQLCHRAFAHPVPALNALPSGCPHGSHLTSPRAAILLREGLFLRTPSKTRSLCPLHPAFVFSSICYSLEMCCLAVWLLPRNISSQGQTFILFTAGAQESHSIQTWCGHSVNTEWMNIEWARTTWFFNFAHEHGGIATLQTLFISRASGAPKPGQFTPWTKQPVMDGSSFRGLSDYFENLGLCKV